jgi:hypothetical protein
MGVLTQGYLTLGTTGLVTYNLGLSTPATWVEIIFSEKNGGDTVSHTSSGMATATKQFCYSTYSDGAIANTFKTNAYFARHYEMVGGLLVPVVSTQFDSFTATGIKLNTGIANTAYQAFVRAGN